MITVIIREKRGAEVCPDIAFEFSIPEGSDGTVKKDRILFKIPSPTPARIPLRGQVTISRPYFADQVTEYSNAIPTIRQRDCTVEDDKQELHLTLSDLEKTVDSDHRLSSLKESIFRHYEYLFPGYGELPNEHWAQLNRLSDEVVVQMKLEKMPPLRSKMDHATGDHYVYGVRLIAIQAKIPVRQVSDLDRVLAI